jgi:hypothetical protein
MPTMKCIGYVKKSLRWRGWEEDIPQCLNCRLIVKIVNLLLLK